MSIRSEIIGAIGFIFVAFAVSSCDSDAEGPDGEAGSDAAAEASSDIEDADLADSRRPGRDSSPGSDASDVRDVDGASEGGYDGPTGGVGITPRADYGSLEDRYVSPSGATDADGTMQDPWNVDGAEQHAEPGQVVQFLPGEYDSTIRPPNGESGNPVVVRSHRRHRARITGGNGFRLDGGHHVHIQGFRFENGDNDWVTLLNTSNIVVRDNFMVGSPAENTRFIIKETGQRIRMFNNVMREGGGHNMFSAWDVENLIMAGNAFTRAGHNPAGIFRNFQRVVVRGNVFHGVIGRNMAINGDATEILFEYNLLANAWNGPKSASTKSKWVGQESIFRFNRVVDNHGIPMTSDLFADWQGELGPTRIYHNVFYGNDGLAWRFWDRGGEYPIRDTDVENNIFAANNGGGPQIQVASQTDANDLDVASNLFEGSDVIRHGRTVGAGSTTLQDAEQKYSDVYSDNLNASPNFEDPKNFHFALAAGSPAVDAGTTLSVTRSAGSGKTVPLEDVRYFYDGFGISGESGDPIQIGDQVATVESVDRSNQTLRVDTSLEWEAGEPVGLPWSGSAPDLGVYPTGEGIGHVVVRAPRRAKVSDEIAFEARVRGDLNPAEICWQFGDGSGTCGQKVTHSYDDAYDYPVRVRVIEPDGSIRWGVHYLYVRDGDTDPSSTDYNESETARIVD